MPGEAPHPCSFRGPAPAPLAHQRCDDLPGDLELDLLKMVPGVEFLPVVLDEFADAAAMRPAFQVVCHDPDKCRRRCLLRLDHQALKCAKSAVIEGFRRA